MVEYQDSLCSPAYLQRSQVQSLEESFFFLLGLSWSDHFYILAGNTAGNGDSEKHMVVVLAIIVSSEISSPSCHFLDRCYCKQGLRGDGGGKLERWGK